MTTSSQKLLLLILFIFSFALPSCGSGSGSKEQAESAKDSVFVTTQYDNTLAKGAIIENVVCTNDASENYALYLPTNYASDKAYPCIYFFDAHARGALPLKLYKAIAEQYGFVLIGSNVSKNGTSPQALDKTATALMADTKAKINIDPRRVYTCGFSGGAKVAAIVAMTKGGIAGIISCAAGLPNIPRNAPAKFAHFGLAGNQDFNVADMRQLDVELGQNGFAHQLLVVDGKHDWASAANFETAVLWMQAAAMKAQSITKNDAIVNALKTDFDHRIAEANKAADMLQARDLAEGAIRALDGLTDIASYGKTVTDLAANPKYAEQEVAARKLQVKEQQMQQELVQNFTTQNEKWWSSKIAELNQKAGSRNTAPEGLVYTRLVNYLGLVGYMYSSQAIQRGDLEHAASFLKIFKMADPKNPDCDYLYGTYYAGKRDTKGVMNALNDAVANGYSDVTQLLSEPAFSNLQSAPEFKAVVEKVKLKYARNN